MSRSWLERVLAVVRELGTSADLQGTLDRIAQAVVDVVEFDAAAINVTRPDGLVRVDAVVGPPGVTELLGQGTPAADWELLLAASQEWGELRFHGHHENRHLWDRVARWTPPTAQGSEPDAWHPEDALFAPLRGPDGALLGVISVDQPRSGRAPDAEQRTVLELFAAQAAAAIADAARRERLADAELVYRTAFLGAPVPSVVLDDHLRVVAANQAFARVVDRPAAELPGTGLAEMVDADDERAVRAACRQVLDRSAEEADLEHRLRTRHGDRLWARTRVARVVGAASGTILVLSVEDVTESRRTLEELRTRAETDQLTGLPNRRVVQRGLRAALDQLPGPAVAVMGCDLDGFKLVNDTHGHLVGDQLLVLVAQRLRTSLAPTDLLVRHGGDEFLVVAVVPDPARAEDIARRCVEAVDQPFDVDGVRCTVSLSVGVVAVVEPVDPSALLARADAALYRAKELGRNRWFREA